MEEKNLDGFTLIEASLTLAIGGLIFLMVFLVLPSVMANARDGQRRDAVLLTVNKLKNFQANNNRGALPTDTIGNNGKAINGSSITFGPTTGTTWADFYKGFFSDDFADPSGGRYNWMIVKCGTTAAGSACTNSKLTTFMGKSFADSNFTMYFVIGAACDGNTAVATPNTRMVSVLYKLERADTYCVNT